jgi:hypothetical protein
MIFNAQTRTMQMAMADKKTYIEMNMGGERGEHLTEALEQ